MLKWWNKFWKNGTVDDQWYLQQTGDRNGRKKVEQKDDIDEDNKQNEFFVQIDECKY